MIVLASPSPSTGWSTRRSAPTVDIRSDPQFLPLPGTLDNYRAVFDARLLLDVVPQQRHGHRCSRWLLALFMAFLAALAISRFRFRGRLAFLVAHPARPDGAGRGADDLAGARCSTAGTCATRSSVSPSPTWRSSCHSPCGRCAASWPACPRSSRRRPWSTASSRLRAFFTVTFPLVAPGLVATGIFAFIQAWNEFTFALVIMDRPEADPAGVAPGLQRGRARHRLGRRDGRLDAHHHPRDRLLPARPPPGRRRHDRRAR